MQKLNFTKKRAAGLMIVIGIITMLSLIIMANYKLITNSHKTFSIRGINDNSTIANNDQHGTYICYKGINGLLNELQFSKTTDGKTRLDKKKFNVIGVCTFNPPSPTLKYNFKLIGGGGGGTKANITKKIMSENYGHTTIYLPSSSIPATKYGDESATLQLFCMQTDQETPAKKEDCWNDYKNKVSDFMKNFSPTVVFEKKGAYEYKCEAKVNSAFDITTLYNDTENNKSNVPFGLSTYSTFSFGGENMIGESYRENLEIYSPDALGDKCRRFSNDNIFFTSLLQPDSGIQVTNDKTEEECAASDLCTGNSDKFYVKPRSVSHSFSRNEINVNEGESGTEGKITTREISGLSEAIIIKPENIGNGGKGETDDTSAENGGVTSIALNDGIKLSANGGTAGAHSSKTRVFRYSDSGLLEFGEIFDSEGKKTEDKTYNLPKDSEGISAMLELPNYVKQILNNDEFKKLKADYKGDDQIDTYTFVDTENMQVFGATSRIEAKGTNFNMIIPERPGTSGAAGLYSLSGHETFLKPYLVGTTEANISVPDEKNINNFIIPQSAGGIGAGGAIIIEW